MAWRPKSLCRLELHFKFLLILAASVPTKAFHYEPPNAQALNPSDEAFNTSPQQLVIQLAIFCDSDFSTLFHGDVIQMLDYWKMVVYGVHTTYQSLSSFNVSFQITSFTVFREPRWFIGKMLDESGKVNIHGILLGMPKWLGPQISQKPSFDIAVLALGAEALDAASAETQGSICLGNSFPDNWVTSIAISVRTPDVAQELSHAIRRVLGASFDVGQYSWKQECKSYINGWTQEFNKEYIDPLKSEHFSDCVNKILLDLFGNSVPVCLKPDESEVNALYDSASLVPGNLSVQDQSRVRTNLTEITRFHDNPCSWIDCSPLKNSDEKAQTLLPLNGSPCKYSMEGVCYQGSCFPHVVNLVNTRTGKCLDGEDEYGKTKTLKECAFAVFPPKEYINLEVDSRYGIRMQLPWTWRCLHIDKDGLLKVGDCLTSQHVGWEFVELETPTRTEFMLRHLATDSCIKSSLFHNCDSGQLISSSKCNRSDVEMHWNLVLENGTKLTPENYGTFVTKFNEFVNKFMTKFDNFIRTKRVSKSEEFAVLVFVVTFGLIFVGFLIMVSGFVVGLIGNYVG